MASIVVKEIGPERVISVCADHLNDSNSADSLSRRLALMFEAGGKQSVTSDPDSDHSGEFAEGPDEPPLETLILDFDLVAWLGSEGLNELISINRQVRTQGIRLVLANVQEPVRKVFALTRLERMFELAETQAPTL